MAYPPYSVKIVVEQDPKKSVMIDGSHTLQVALSGGTMTLAFTHNDERQDTVPMLILNVKTP